MAGTFTMADNQKAERKLMVTYVDVGTGSTPTWERVGHGIEDSSIEYNSEVTTVTDILGITETQVDSTAPQQSREPFTIRGGSALALKLYDIMRRNALSELSLFKVLVAYGFVKSAGSTTAYEAELHSGCTIEVTSLGGSGHVDMPIVIHFSNDKTLGTVNSLGENPTFTEAK